MSFATFCANGGVGTLQFRLDIEGWPDIWTTDGDNLAATATDTRVVRRGLQVEFTLTERVQLQEGTFDVSSVRMLIIDDENETATTSFAKKPTVVGWLQETTTTTDPETWIVTNASGFTTNSYYHIGTECVKVTAKTATTITVARAQWDTQAQVHYGPDSTLAENLVYQPITDLPGSIRNRRANLYVYEGDDELGSAASTTNNIKDGTLMWRGRVLRPPTHTGVAWDLTVDSIASILEQKITGVKGDEPLGLRGIYYHWQAPFRVQIYEADSATWGSGYTGAPQVDFFVTGLFTTEDELLASINGTIATQITANLTSSPDVMIARETNGEWVVHITASTRYISVVAFSPMDGVSGNTTPSPMYAVSTIDGATPVYSMSSGVTYFQRFFQASIPVIGGRRFTPGDPVDEWPGPIHGNARMYWGTIDDDQYWDPTAASSAPENRIHVARAHGLVATDAVIIETNGLRYRPFTLSAVDQADAPSIELSIRGGQDIMLTGADTTIIASREYSTDGTLEDLRAALVTAATTANSGSTPHITGNDVETWSEVASAAADRPYTAHRRYVFHKEKTLKEVFAEEAKLLGGMFRLSSAGKIDFKRLRVLAPTDPGTVTLDSTVVKPRPQWPSYAKEPSGIRNVVRVHYGYDPVEDKHLEPYVVRDVTSISIHKDEVATEIKPYSAQAGGALLNWPEAVEVAQGLTHHFGADYTVVKLPVSWSVFTTALLGETALVTDTRIPNSSTGTRGVTSLRGIIIGREWQLPGFGILSVLVQDMNVGGYAPAARITGAADGGLNKWTLTVTQNLYAPSGINDTSHFAANDIVETVEADLMEPRTQTGTVESTTATTVVVQFDGTAAWGAVFDGTHDLLFRDDGTAYTPTSAQGAYVYIGDSAGLLYDSNAARVLAP